MTYIYSQDVGESLKESIALHMGHRVETAKQVYDRRTFKERRMAGIAYTSNLVQQIRDTEPQPDSSTENIIYILQLPINRIFDLICEKIGPEFFFFFIDIACTI